MKLSEQPINDFLKLLASDAPAPGGGGGAALCSASGIALTGMVTAFTVGKPKYAEYDELNRRVQAGAESLRLKLAEGINKDKDVFNGVSAVYGMPKSTDEEKAARTAAMQEALKAATAVPFEVMELSLEALVLTSEIVGRSNPNVASDIGVAALSLQAGVKSAWLNVLINLAGIKDEAFVNKYKSKGQEMLTKAEALSGDIYDKILATM